ncbi:hypothetical protein [Mesorhizobium sp. Cs1321R2N1]|uniref:hypothetical protein n=1 Tax=Mesorhizobium sp. Cs1321R2N1 TaxID=3015174 RepID=UPI00301C4433
MVKERILIVGLDPKRIQFGGERGLTAEKVSAAGDVTNARLAALGHDVQAWLIAPDATVEPLVELLEKGDFSVILVAAGLRGLPEHTLLFETIMNVIHKRAPSASLCFNSRPTDAFDAIMRHIKSSE